MLLLLTVFVAAAAIVVTTRLLKARANASFGAPPPPIPQPCHWLFGHIPLITPLTKAGQHIDTLIQDVIRSGGIGKVFALHLLVVDIIVVQDADAVKEAIATKNFAKSYTYNALHPFIGSKSIIVTEGEAWSQQRKAFNPSFAYTFLKQLLPTFAEKALNLVCILDQFVSTDRGGPIVKLMPLVTGLTLDIICQVALAESFDCLATVHNYLTPSAGSRSGSSSKGMLHLFQELLDATAQASSGPHLRWMKYIPWLWWRLYVKQARFDGLLMGVIKKRVQQIKASGQQPTDILSMAIATAAGEGGALDLENILAQVKSFLFAGHDTTATTVSFAIYEVSCNAEIERKLVEELVSVCGSRDPTADDLSQLKYMSCVVKETLRMWPPGGTARIGAPGSTLHGFDVSGKVLYIAHLPIHRDPDYWGPDAHEFKPERWQDEHYVANLHPFCYMPFSKGQRDCIGQNFANLEVRTLLAMLFSRYSFKYAGEKPEEQGFRITTFPKFGVPVRIYKRDSFKR